jgi:hypothetical protein
MMKNEIQSMFNKNAEISEKASEMFNKNGPVIID